ncbi:hypothetical protein [Thermogemmatispora carboxidivorans]|uniref:hypothetical protein n=1 Tax=Thermogemmatispora carboxidivorans TaxID=1382306 RepID=UPI000699DE2D|nr:hypothetical protein [Thermogemmatispora carboxidivorans]
MPERVLTIADLCAAIAEGRIPATVKGSTYHVNALELRRYLNRLRPLPFISVRRSLHCSPESGRRRTP